MILSGSAVAAANDVTLGANGLPLGQLGFFMTSSASGLVLMPGASAGTLCLSGSIGRYNSLAQVRNSGAAGAFSLRIALGSTPTPLGPVAVLAGQTRHFQAWYRDAPGRSNFSDAVRLTFQ